MSEGLQLSRILDEQKSRYLLTIVNIKNQSWTAHLVVEEVERMGEKSRENMVVHYMEPGTLKLQKCFDPTKESKLPGGAVKNVKRRLKRKNDCLLREQEKDKEGNDHFMEIPTGVIEGYLTFFFMCVRMPCQPVLEKKSFFKNA